jgi:hypothetical protein
MKLNRINLSTIRFSFTHPSCTRQSILFLLSSIFLNADFFNQTKKKLQHCWKEFFNKQKIFLSFLLFIHFLRMLINYATFNLNRAPSLPVSKMKKFLLSYAYNSFFPSFWCFKKQASMKRKAKEEKSDVNGLLGEFLKRTKTTIIAKKNILLARKSVIFFPFTDHFSLPCYCCWLFSIFSKYIIISFP